MSLAPLALLAEPWFVIAWYAVGVAGAALVIVDIRTRNSHLAPAMRWAWPIVIVFLSIIAIALYVTTARSRSPGRFGRTNGAVLHCVAGDGLGIMTAMVIARLTGMSFWQEFWFEYAVGFAFGWFIFQYRSMKPMSEWRIVALAMALRAELFSMLTVMGGMGAVMGYVTPLATGAQPSPLTAAFWGFGALGLLVGYVFTFPMNWLIVMLGWKHGMGPREEAPRVSEPVVRRAIMAAMVALGLVAMFVPAWLVHARTTPPVTAALPAGGAGGAGADARVAPLAAGLTRTLDAAIAALERGDRSHAAVALDAALRAADVGSHGTDGVEYDVAHLSIRRARHALWNNDVRGAAREAAAARVAVETGASARPRLPARPAAFVDADVIDAEGTKLGEVVAAGPHTLHLALGGVRNLWGVVDLTARERRAVPASALLFGDARHVGRSYVMLRSPRAARPRRPRRPPRARTPRPRPLPR